MLGIPTWRFDGEGRRIAGPGGFGSAAAWLDSGPVERLVAEAVAAWLASDEPATARVADGLWMAPLIDGPRRRRRGITAAMILGPEFLDGPCFRETCGRAGLDFAAARAAVAPLAVFTERDAERTVIVLGWHRQDLEALSIAQDSVSSFSLRLAESYEEITLLQNLGRSMNQVAHPQKFVSLACDELQKTLPYEWVAVRFAPERRLARGMAGRMHLSGHAPCFDADLERDTAHLLEGLSPKEARVLQPQERGSLGKGDSQLLIQPVAREGQIAAAIFAGCKKGDDPQVSSTDIKLLEAASAYLSILLDNAILYDDQQIMFMGTLEALTSSIDAKDPYTCGHSERVAELAAALARAHGLDDEPCERVRLAGIIHDVGKIGVPEAVLCKTGRLTEEEFALIKQHPEIGYQILRDIPQFEDLLPGVLYHHERFDGRGYPNRLKGAGIPLMARIIGLVDAFDAMSSNRTYRSAMPRDRVFEELADNAGAQFDPELVEAFQRVDLARYDELVEKHQHAGTMQTGGLRIRRTGLAA